MRLTGFSNYNCLTPLTHITKKKKKKGGGMFEYAIMKSVILTEIGLVKQ